MNIFVTGAAQGIGLAMATAFHGDGENVVLADISRDLAQVAAAELGERALAVELDIADESSWDNAWNTAKAAVGDIDVLVNNAARTPTATFWQVTADEWDDVLAVNLRGTFLGCRVAAFDMRERRSGRIVNLASLAGQQGGLVAGPHYAASKAGVIVLTKIVAAELAPYQATCNAVAPAAIDGPVVQQLQPERREAIAQSIPVKRLGRAEEVASLVKWLASDAAAFVTGATFDVNGGLHAR